MLESYLKKNIIELKSKLPILIRPLITIAIFYFLALSLSQTNGYLLLGLCTSLIQLDLIITTNHHFFMIIRDNRLYDIVISKRNIYVFVIYESLFSLLYYVLLQIVISYYVTANMTVTLLLFFICFISILIGLSIIPLTLKRKSFIISSKIASVMLLFGCVLIPLDKFSILSNLLIFNVYTPIFEYIRSNYYDYSTNMTHYLTMLIINIAIIVILFIVSTQKLKKELS